MICTLLVVGMFITCCIIPSVLRPEETIFWVTGDKYHFIFLFEALVILFVPLLIKERRKNKMQTRCNTATKILKKFWWLILCIFIVFAFIIVSDTTYITDNQIVHKTIANPRGTSYMYDDVAGVDTGFYGKKQFGESLKGDFFYYIRLKDGTRINLNNAGAVYEEKIPNYVTYKEIQAFDNKIMRLDIDKISSYDFIESNHLLQMYQEIFLGIIKNK